MEKFIVTAWKNNDFTIRESVAYDADTAEDIKLMYNNFGYNAIVTPEEISDVEEMFVRKFEGIAA